jgi:hypothetical protein
VRGATAALRGARSLAHDAARAKRFSFGRALARALEISQAAAGVGVRPVPGAAPHNHLSRKIRR